MANKKQTASSSQLVLSVPALAFAVAMLGVGSIAGYMVGKAQGITEGSASSSSSAPATAAAPTPGGTVVNNTDGQLRRLSEAEKQKLLAGQKSSGPSAKGKEPPPPPADSPYMSEDILSSIDDPVLLVDYKRAVGYMSKGNARAARPTLIKLERDSSGKAWEEPVAALLCDARSSMGNVDEGRKAIETFKKTWPKSKHLAQVWIAEGKTHMHEGKRLKRAPNQDPKGPPNSEQKKSYRQAIKLFDTVLSRWPEHPVAVEALLNKSALLVDLGDFAAAEAAAVELAEKHKTSQHAARGLSTVARNAMSSGDYERAERIYRKLATDFPRDRAAKGAQSQLQSLRMLGKDAPALSIVEWIGEDVGSIASQRGKTTVVVFWATWCPACRRALPAVQEFYERNKGPDFEMIAVTRHSKGQTSQKVRDYMAENNYTFPVAVDEGGGSRAYGVTGIPAAAMIDKKGKVVFRNHPAQLTDELLAKHR